MGKKLAQDDEASGKDLCDFDEDELLPCHYFDFMYGTSTGQTDYEYAWTTSNDDSSVFGGIPGC